MTIQTKWHKFREAVQNKGDDRIGIIVKKGAPENDRRRMQTNFEQKELEQFVRLSDKLPVYCIDTSLIHRMSPADVAASVKALHDAGLAKLPYPSLIVEYDETTQTPNGFLVRNIVTIFERSPESKRPEEEMFHPFQAIVVRMYTKDGVPLFALSLCSVCLGFDNEAGPNKEFGVHYFGIASPLLKAVDETVKSLLPSSVEQDMRVAGLALQCLVLLLHTKGAARDVIRSERLNKARAKQGKPPIPDHTVIRIGTVYDRAGKGHVYDPNSPKRHVRVHWRRGHTRNVPCGTGRSERRVVFIEPCLVNYQDGPAPAPQKALVKWA